MKYMSKRNLYVGLATLLIITSISASANIRSSIDAFPSYNNGLAQKPLLGWSSWSFLRQDPTETRLMAQADALFQTLQAHGYTYINLDDFWYLNPSTTVDNYGRWAVDTSRFPDGIIGTAAYVHSLGLKFGIYVTPGIPVAAVKQNTSIEGTSYHARDIADTSEYETNYNFGSHTMYAIDYSKPGAEAYIQSWANLFASWGVDFVKIDGVGEQDAGDIQAWSNALRRSGRPIYLQLSNMLDINDANMWRQYANGWRTSDDIECYCTTLTDWSDVATRFTTTPQWAQWAGKGGWNDLDSLDVGNGLKDGLTDAERQTYMTLWAISAAPLYSGDDLTQLDSYGISLLTNDAVIAVDQAGIAATPLSTNTEQQIWRAHEADGSYIVALFNLGAHPAKVTVNWSDLGISGAVTVTDLWSHTSQNTFSASFSATLASHASRLLKVVPTT